MKNRPKLTLDLDSLDVQSFSASPSGSEGRGTVLAHASIEPGCTSFQECGGPGGSYECFSYGQDCTWHPEVFTCYSNPIAFPTEWNCDQGCPRTQLDC